MSCGAPSRRPAASLRHRPAEFAVVIGRPADRRLLILKDAPLRQD
jgi:hypothetical protein